MRIELIISCVTGKRLNHFDLETKLTCLSKLPIYFSKYINHFYSLIVLNLNQTIYFYTLVRINKTKVLNYNLFKQVTIVIETYCYLRSFLKEE